MPNDFPYLEQTWRWFGPEDPIPLKHIRQAGATGIVTALHHFPNGAAWPRDEIARRKKQIEQAGLRWSVVESVPVHEDIKQARGEAERYLANYAETLRHLAACGIKVVCYNFMPLLDWTRTCLNWKLPDGSEALRFDATDAAVFDLHILERPGAKTGWPAAMLEQAALRNARMSKKERDTLRRTVLMGLPGSVKDLSLEEFREQLQAYAKIDSDVLRRNYALFLRRIVPEAEKCGISLALHPDDPPFEIFGLPRIAGTCEDLASVLKVVDSPANGLTFCTGSLGANPSNDLPSLFRQVAPRVSFVHLRSVQREHDGSFFEADHLGGSTDMAAVMHVIVQELKRRSDKGDVTPLPMRPDHGHRMLGDLRRSFYPGYSAIGRLRGLAELRGLERGIRFQMGLESSLAPSPTVMDLPPKPSKD